MQCDIAVTRIVAVAVVVAVVVSVVVEAELTLIEMIDVAKTSAAKTSRKLPKSKRKTA